MLHARKRTQKRAAEFRRELSLREVLLWQELRKRLGGLKFRHQHPAGRYVLDFFCAGRHLAIEVDGEAHVRGDRPERDAERDRWLAEQRVRVLRIRRATFWGISMPWLGILLMPRGGNADSYPTTTGFAGGPPPLRGRN